MTPYELRLFIQDYKERMQEEQEERITLAYLTAYWGRVKKMPNLKELLGKSTTKHPQTDKEMLAKVRQLNAIFGGEVVKEGGETWQS